MATTQAGIDIDEAVRSSKLTGYVGNYRELGGGEFNDTFALDCADQQVILRIAKYTDQHTLATEAWALALFSSPNAPNLLYFNERQRIRGRQWIMESFVPGTAVSRLSLGQFASLGALLARIHSHKTDTIGVNIWERFLSNWRFGTEQSLLNHSDLALRHIIRRCRKYCLASQPLFDHVIPTLVHGDVSVGNILTHNDGVALIDWEYAKYNDPMSEFSGIFYDDMEYNRGKWRIHITEPERRALFDGYRDGGGVIDEERLEFWILFDKFCSALFLDWRIHESGQAAADDQMAQYKTDLENLVKSLEAKLPL